ncbi:peptidoglycan-binding protein [Bacillus shivajii]|uniref:C40 family peptidase n=1 Tax=Bacillus shivajii TaxID=1983719 RepID=UPI001CF9F3DB|nr:peptidoglycan-binding protein [Bacillus shivajii]UCZ52973.1 peptidoglycan-binding protein [Bacillus shivajii]
MSFFDSKVRSAIFVSAAATSAIFVAPNLAEASFGDQTLRIGMESPDVKELQELLKEKGYFQFHTATGYFGEITREAVRDFQRSNDLTVDGIVGPQTFGALNENAIKKKQANEPKTKNETTESTSTDTYNGEPIRNANQVLRQGARGEDVVRLQLYLKKAGFFDHHEATGYYGNVTEKAVRRFQQARGLTIDGLAGPQTLTKVNKEIKDTGASKEESSSNSNSSSSSSTSSNQVDLSNVILREGSRGENVKTLQTRLKDLGYYNGNISGTYGAQTVEAVRELQRQTNINIDGIFGPQTFAQLEKNLPKETESSSSSSDSGESSSDTLLKKGSRGESVKELQHMLKAIGHFKQEPTGYFGPITKDALVAFQKDWGLNSDGTVTKSTWEKLEEIASIHMEEPQVSAEKSFNTLNVIADAADLVGVPYLWGGTTQTGFDCSGFVQYVFKKNGVNLPRTVAEQWNATKSVSKPQVGDIVYFETYRPGPSHNGIYIGNNQFIHSGSSTGVTIASLNNSYWGPRYLGARSLK